MVAAAVVDDDRQRQFVWRKADAEQRFHLERGIVFAIAFAVNGQRPVSDFPDVCASVAGVTPALTCRLPFGARA
ncbi:hypothetical protein RGCCGE502_26558 [Rhizobium grahamii CCGE 502]|uniref:Uncharacterized protein n=1 Tax=Rhizobium grahamii CCGE 502 TaxID=990285 RepID=S3HQB5_9HYPH|nr:hypothetical protein RGCCGE502_26558 [Rhizobium grahamii CCGE 502]